MATSKPVAVEAARLTNDLEPYWMPFTANRQFKAQPRLLVGAKGLHYTTADGRRILDGTAGLWCCNAGHGHPKIVAAIQRQAAEMDYAPAFQMGHPKAFELAARVAALLSGDLDHVFFTNSGSEAVDTALKIALAYHRACGEATRTRRIGRERCYHGVGFGGMSVGGIANNRKFFGPLLSGVDHLPHTHLPEKNAFSRGEPAHGAHLAEELERIVALHDASTIAAVIVEPVACSTGVLVPPKGYLKRLREICSKHGILLFHGYTYSGHPLACAAGLAALDVYAEERLFDNARTLSPYWEDAVHALKGLPHVIDLRNLGLIAAIELEPIAGQPAKRAFDAFLRAYDKGLLVRTTGDIIALSPPLTITKAQIDEIFGTLAAVLKETP